ncbi:MAG: class II fructose-bisphosphate aldolase [Oscillospiraceae bacterium]|nr:class II fructose-bisphosphate aldolase [Oscillospiraceae bacterium]
MLVNLKTILEDAHKNRYAVASFNFNSFEDCKGMVEAAVNKRSPVILMATSTTVRYIGLQTVTGMVRGMAKEVDVPVCLHLDHATDLSLIFACVEAGFSSVMIDASREEYLKNIELTKMVVEKACKFSCSVEGELGKISGHEDDFIADGSELTNPQAVPRFVKETGLDALAVAIGTVHGFYKSEPQIDFLRLDAIRKATDIPLVLHGGTGLSEDEFRKCISMGMSKVNIGTEIKYVFSQALRDAATRLGDEMDPRRYLGEATRDCCEVVKHKIDMFGCAGKAESTMAIGQGRKD